jgi:hypothetical protein
MNATLCRRRASPGKTAATASNVRRGGDAIAAAVCDAPQRSFRRVVIDCDAPVVTIASQGLPATQRIADRFGHRGFLRECLKRLLQPHCHGVEQWEAAFPPHRAALVGRATTNLFLGTANKVVMM